MRESSLLWLATAVALRRGVWRALGLHSQTSGRNGRGCLATGMRSCAQKPCKGDQLGLAPRIWAPFRTLSPVLTHN